MKKFTVLCLVLCLILALCGCKAYQEHSKNISAVEGEWVLDSKYVNTRSVEHPEAYMTINADHSGTYTEMVQATIVNENGETIPVTEVVDGQTVIRTEAKTTNITVSSPEEGTLTITMEGTSINYRFNVDEAAGNLHLWIDEDGDEVHYIFILKSVY
ncbi:MAG: hypothetical protein IIZ17_01845 [Eubacteriaceae bacterium]|nr:hypothetical protein [Eubacteriaceae bacterium]MCR4894330.1 hypothetical protein [Eubacteriales bacterium]